jgi:hypothetical protein
MLPRHPSASVTSVSPLCVSSVLRSPLPSSRIRLSLTSRISNLSPRTTDHGTPVTLPRHYLHSFAPFPILVLLVFNHLRTLLHLRMRAVGECFLANDQPCRGVLPLFPICFAAAIFAKGTQSVQLTLAGIS